LGGVSVVVEGGVGVEVGVRVVSELYALSAVGVMGGASVGVWGGVGVGVGVRLGLEL
jgi:hypothetical protein